MIPWWVLAFAVPISFIVGFFACGLMVAIGDADRENEPEEMKANLDRWPA